MKTKWLASVGVAAVLLAAGSIASAQDAAPPALPPPGPAGDTIFIHAGAGPGPMVHEGIGFLGFEAGLGDKTVTGAPFSANFSTEFSQTLADGNQIQHSSTGSIARDSEGRTRRDLNMPAMGAWMFVSGQSLSHVTFINDPVAGTRYLLEQDKKIARQLPEPPNRADFVRKDVRQGERGPEHDPEAQKEVVTTSLGTQTIGGVPAQGTRYTRTIPAGEIGNTKPIVIVSERWYSPELQTVVMTKRSDPRSGETTFQLTNIQRQEPAATMFQVPSDYTVTQGPPHGEVRGAAPIPPPEP
jgi:hypothetical protein